MDRQGALCHPYTLQPHWPAVTGPQQGGAWGHGSTGVLPCMSPRHLLGMGLAHSMGHREPLGTEWGSGIGSP